MPKLRNVTSDVGKMAQYLARKCVIHSPQSELDWDANETEKKSQRFGKNKHYEGSQVHMLREADSPEFVVISPKGRAMRVTVEEINPEELQGVAVAEVGE